jgi:glycosyltransferase involved in cell wall biosynthesis
MNVTFREIIGLLFLLVSAFQLYYYLFFFSRLAFYKKRPAPPLTANLPLSVVVCARNEERNLRMNLPVILQQRYMNADQAIGYEVIVVNDNSEDDTRHFLNSIAPGYPHFRQIELKQEAKLIPGKKYPLSMGMKGAAYDIVVLTDADCKPSSADWLALMSEGFTKGKDIVLGYGPYLKEPGFLNCMIRFETFFSALQYLSFALAGKPYMGVGRNLAYRKELFFRHKGFLAHQHIPSGDDDLFINAAATPSNTSVIVDSRAFTYSAPKRSWKDWIRQKSRHLTTGKYYRKKNKILLGGWLCSQLLFYPLFILGLIFIPLLWIPLGIFIARFVVLGISDFLIMRKLDEADLFPLFWAWDILICIYFIWAIPASLFPPRARWN